MCAGWCSTVRNSAPKRRVWPTKRNEGFEASVKARLDALGVTPEDTIIVMCRRGSSHSAPAADVINAMGYTEVWSVTDGFEGGTLKEGESKGVRAVDGWRNSGPPWRYKGDPGIAWTQEWIFAEPCCGTVSPKTPVPRHLPQQEFQAVAVCSRTSRSRAAICRKTAVCGDPGRQASTTWRGHAPGSGKSVTPCPRVAPASTAS